MVHYKEVETNERNLQGTMISFLSDKFAKVLSQPHINGSQLAASVGCTYASIKNYKEKKSKPSALTLYGICEVLNLDIHSFFKK
jgi:transcriptional regulator with XRE-family HTH domain